MSHSMPSESGIRFNLTRGVWPMACNMLGNTVPTLFLKNRENKNETRKKVMK